MRVTRADETPAEHANRVRAAVAEGAAPPERLRFADWLVARD